MTIPDSERERMIEALTRVAERSLYAFAEAVPADLMPRTIDGGWHVASLKFSGPFSGEVSMAVPVVLGRQMCTAFLGDDEVDDETAVRDLVGEFANMTCGTWLTARQDAGCFDLTHPNVVAVDAVPGCDLAFVVNDMPVMLSMQIVQAAS